MNDPYITLGVTSSATLDEIKAAYRELAKKYHPDNYADNPDMQAFATEKMKEINEAYDEILRIRRSGGTAYTDYSSIRQMIRNGRLFDADSALNSVDSASRGAEWHFLKGTVYLNNGWVNDAEREFEFAVRLEPSNGEYTAALNSIKNTRSGQFGGYNTSAPNYGSGSGCSGCDVCTGLMCADCCCECMGGDLIRCC